MKTSLGKLLTLLAACLLPLSALAQVNSGSNGSDGVLNPTSNLVINMADHPDGIYHYTSVNIPTGVTVSFIPNAGNKPVVWLVQTNCVIAGTISVKGNKALGIPGAAGGPGGYGGGNGPAGPGITLSQTGFGPGGGQVTSDTNFAGGNGSFGTKGAVASHNIPGQYPSGDIYGNPFLLPLIGGSGGSGSTYHRFGGSGGGGAILIAVSGDLTLQSSGAIDASGGGTSTNAESCGGGGSGGAIRLIATSLTGNGLLDTTGGRAPNGQVFGTPQASSAGNGRVRIDAFSDSFTGGVVGAITRGVQPIIIPPANQAVSLAIQSVGGVAVAATPTGQFTTPDVIVPANQQNPIPIVVSCANIPLNTEVIVDVKPANGATVRAVALSTAGTQASSTATVSVNMPRGGGTIQAKAVSGLALTASNGKNDKARSIAETGWTAEGERFAQVEVTAALGGKSQISYLTESGKRYPVPSL